MDEQRAENGKLTEENKETKVGTTRDGDVPVNAFACEASVGEQEAVDAQKQKSAFEWPGLLKLEIPALWMQ